MENPRRSARSVRFTAVNIVDPGETRAHGQFDVIFCRNVLIYFDDASRRLAAENLYENLQPGGYICLGHTESMSRISPLFDVAASPTPSSIRDLRRWHAWVTSAEARARGRRREPRPPVLSRRAREGRVPRRGSAERAGGAREAARGARRPADRRRQHAADGRLHVPRTLRRQDADVSATPALVTSTESGPQDRRRARGGRQFLSRQAAERASAGGVRRAALRRCA